MTTLSQQFWVFGLTIVLGVLTGVLFDFYRVLNRLSRPPRLVTQVTDLLFWLLLTGVIFLLLFLGNWGEFRGYVVLGLVLGLLLYLRWFSRTTVWFLSRSLRLAYRGFSWIVWIVGWPVRFFARIVVVPIGKVSLVIRRLISPFFKMLNSFKESGKKI